MKTLILSSLIIFQLAANSLAQTLEWKLEREYLNRNIEAWDISPLEELIISEQGTLHKLDTNFNLSFTQSRKGFGNISKIDARHSLKTLIFSENQQSIGFLDNTLSFQEGKIDLAQLSIGFATQVCYSDQTNRFWVFDEQNARLVRFEGVNSSVARSEISNLMAITYSDMPSTMVERQNQLFLFYEGVGLFVFDYYGSLIRKYPYESALQVYPTEKYLYILEKDSIVRFNMKLNKEESVTLPKEGIEELRVFGNKVYLKDKKGVSKYSLIRLK
ncbi:hypothetical protein [Brumimicrobium oceani]|uniref:Uncharacterized protein n=1 Tax=Brumimicrobium oceani TaxID=2100725 RepID=A0A2U2XDH2_9FLAO|nr:hypothetical protein [Brumimicrobium oceani]PWH85807.1 hypothetical protein DIT68_06855 [Brumimicrobium oceani]